MASKGGGSGGGWVSTTAKIEGDGRRTQNAAVSAPRELPAKPTGRTNTEQANDNGKLNQQVLSAFRGPLSAPGKEDSEFAAARFRQVEADWQRFSTECKREQDKLEEDSFSKMFELAGDNIEHVRQQDEHLVRSAILSTRGPLTGDHAQTFTKFQAYLKDQGAYTALLEPHHFQGGLGALLQEILRQMSGLEASVGDDIQALHQWYEDQTGYLAEEANNLQQQQAQQQQQGTQPGPSRGGSQRQQQQGGKGSTKTPAGKTPGRATRGKAAAALPGQQQLVTSIKDKYKANRKRAVVIIVRAAEEIGTPALRDLLGALLLDYRRFPATLVLCCCKPASLYLKGLPESVRSRMSPEELQLPSQGDRLERLFTSILSLGPGAPTVLLSERPMRSVLHHYEHLGEGVHGIIGALQAAHIHHYASTPLSMLASAALCCSTSAGGLGGRGGKGVAGGGRQPAEEIDLMSSSSDSESSQEGNEESDEEEEGGGKEVGGSRRAPGKAPGRGQKGAGSTPAAAQRGRLRTQTLEQVVSALPPPVLAALVQELQDAAGGDAAAPAAGVGGSAAVGAAPATAVAAAEGTSREGRGSRPAAAAGAGASKSRASAGGGAGNSTGSTASKGKGGGKGAHPGAALQNQAESVQLVVGHVQAAAQALTAWKLGVNWASVIAHRTAGGSAAARPQLRLASLYLAASSKGFWAVPRAAGAAGRGRKGSPGQQLVQALAWWVGQMCGSEECHQELAELLGELMSMAQASQRIIPSEAVAPLIPHLRGLITELRCGEVWGGCGDDLLSDSAPFPGQAGGTFAPPGGTMAVPPGSTTQAVPRPAAGTSGSLDTPMARAIGDLSILRNTASPTAAIRRGLETAQLGSNPGSGGKRRGRAGSNLGPAATDAGEPDAAAPGAPSGAAEQQQQQQQSRGQQQEVAGGQQRLIPAGPSGAGGRAGVPAPAPAKGSKAARKLQLNQMSGYQDGAAAAGAGAPGPAARGGAGAEAGAGQLAPGNQGPPAAQQQGQGDACTQEGKEGQQGPTPLHKRLPNFVRNAMMQLLGRNPFNMPGSRVFTFHDARVLEEGVVMPQPRAALHEALTHPSRALEAPHLIDDANPLSTDIEIAYQRLLGCDTALVPDWFNDFCEVMSMPLEAQVPGAGVAKAAAAAGTLPKVEEGGEEEDEDMQEAGAGSKRGRGRAAAGKASAANSSQAAAAAGKGTKRKAGAQSQPPQPGAGRRADAGLEERAKVWAARFSHAVAELEHLGIVRPSKRKKEQAVTRTFHPTETQMAKYGLAV